MNVHVTRRRDDGAVMEAAVISQGCAIFCQRIDFHSWEPLYALVDGSEERQPLPSCFLLNDEAIRTLEGACEEGV